MRNLAGYLVLDALIGNTDRHHENWALLRKDVGGTAQHRLAPSFDHASSLGREMRDERRELLLREDRVKDYVQKAEGAIYLNVRLDPLSPLALVEQLAPKHPDEFRPWLERVKALNETELAAPLERIPDGWMTQPQKQFALALLIQSRTLLANLLARDLK